MVAFVNGRFSEWWIANNQLQGIDTGPVGDGGGTAAAIGGNPSTSADSTSLIIRPPASPVIVSASGDFDNNTIPDFIWRRPSDGEMGMWSYNGATQRVSTTDLGMIDFNWAVLGGAHYQGNVDSTASQILMDYVPTGTMTLLWVSNGQLTGIDLGQRWNNIGFVATDPGHHSLGLPNDFLVSNLTDHHLYDWWIDGNNTLQGVDFGAYWVNVALVGVGKFSKVSSDFLVANTVDHHLYDWWMTPTTLQGIDLGPVWSNVTYVGPSWSPRSLALDSFLVANTVDHHLYEWWIDFNNTLQGVDLGPHWSNVQLVAAGDFDLNARGEILVQNTVDHHLYEWWISNGFQLAGIDLGPYWSNVQLVGQGHFNNNNSGGDELLVRNTIDGHFYEWWIANNQLQGVDLGSDLVAAARSNPSSGTAAAAAPPATNTAATNSNGAVSPAAPASAAEPASPVGPTLASPMIDAGVPSTSADSTSLVVRPPSPPVIVVASGEFDLGGSLSSHPEFIWRRPGDAAMGMWTYDPAAQVVTTTNLGTLDFNWAVLRSGGFLYPSLSQPGQMLMDYVPTGTMTLLWVANGQLTGLDLGQRWTNAGLVATSVPAEGPFNPYRGLPEPDFFVSNLTDHHLYDWWIGLDNKLEGIDLGPYWSNIQLVASGPFRGSDFDPDHQSGILVQNTLDHHLYDWWLVYDPSSPERARLAGFDLGPVWSNVTFVSLYPSLQQLSFLVANTVDHHLYDWWISGGALQGIDLGPYWSNVQLVATGLFDDKHLGPGSDEEFLVQNTVDHHLYEWWVTPQGQLAGIDLGPYWVNVQLVGSGYYNVVSPGTFDDLLVRNTLDGHFYEWWIANNQLQGVDLGPGPDPIATASAGAAALATNPAPTGTSGALQLTGSTSLSPPMGAAGSALMSSGGSFSPISSDSTSLLLQSMASFGSSVAPVNASGALLGTDPSHQSALAAPIHLAHG